MLEDGEWLGREVMADVLWRLLESLDWLSLDQQLFTRSHAFRQSFMYHKTRTAGLKGQVHVWG